MSYNRKLIVAGAAIAIGLMTAQVPARAADTDSGTTVFKPDNTKINMRDRSTDEMTADQQGDSQADREITQKIRSVLVHDENLSEGARNVKVITRDGLVTLKGPVASEQERQEVLRAATSVAARKSITDEISLLK